MPSSPRRLLCGYPVRGYDGAAREDDYDTKIQKDKGCRFYMQVDPEVPLGRSEHFALSSASTSRLPDASMALSTPILRRGWAVSRPSPLPSLRTCSARTRAAVWRSGEARAWLGVCAAGDARGSAAGPCMRPSRSRARPRCCRRRRHGRLAGWWAPSARSVSRVVMSRGWARARVHETADRGRSHRCRGSSQGVFSMYVVTHDVENSPKRSLGTTLRTRTDTPSQVTRPRSHHPRAASAKRPCMREGPRAPPARRPCAALA